MIEEIIELENTIGINVRYSLGNKTSILFIHFSGGTLQMWNGVLPLFEKEYSVIAPDLRGHGKSDKPLMGYHIDDMANDMYLLLKELNITKCHIVGSSLGAEIGLNIASSHPGMVVSIVCEGALYNEFGEYGLFYGSNEEIENEKLILRDQLSKRILPNCKTETDYIEEVKTPFVQLGLWNEYVLAYLKSTMIQMENGNYTNRYQNYVRTEYITKYWDVRFEDYYKNILCPVLFLPSQEESENEKVSKSLTYFSSLVEKYEVMHIENALHAYVWMQYPSQVGEIVKNFISKYELKNKKASELKRK